MSAIPTEALGVQFRSRLEARWAYMFELLEWPWHYEPLDLDGYIPDFLIDFPRPLLVEVKPALTFWELEEAYPKVIASGWDKDCLIVGALLSPRGVNDDGFGVAVGALEMWWGDLTNDERVRLARSRFVPMDTGCVFRCTADHWGLCQVSGGWGCWHCGEYDGDDHFEDAERAIIQAHWREAGNRVQWGAPA